MPNPVEGFFEVYEDMVEVMMVFEIFLTKDRRLNMLSGAPVCSEACLFFSDDLLRLWLK